MQGGEHIQRGEAGFLLGGLQQTVQGLGQGGIRLLHEKLHAVFADIGGLEAEMPLHDGVLLVGEGHALGVIVGIGAGVGLSVGQSLQHRSPLGGGTVAAEQDGKGSAAAVGIHLGDEGAGHVDHVIIPCQNGDGADMAGEIRLAHLDLMPREHAGGVGLLLAGKGIQQSAEEGGILLSFLQGIEITPHGGGLPEAVGLPQAA